MADGATHHAGEKGLLAASTWTTMSLKAERVHMLETSAATLVHFITRYFAAQANECPAHRVPIHRHHDGISTIRTQPRRLARSTRHVVVALGNPFHWASLQIYHSRNHDPRTLPNIDGETHAAGRVASQPVAVGAANKRTAS